MRFPIPTHVRGFTRVDVIAIAGVIALLGLLMLPALADSERHSRAAICAINLKRLLGAWSAFAADHSDTLPFNANAPTGQFDWCGGSWLDLIPSNPNNWNHELYTKRSQLWPYVLDASVFSCPDDPTRARAGSGPDAGRFVPRIRSYSMNNWMHGSPWVSGAWTVYTNLAQVTAAAPDQLWVLMDEHPESINDGFFALDMQGYPNSPQNVSIVDFPAYYHGRGATLGFADGRAEVRVWRDNRTVRTGSLQLGVSSPNNPDIIWLQQRSTRPLN